MRINVQNTINNATVSRMGDLKQGDLFLYDNTLYMVYFDPIDGDNALEVFPERDHAIHHNFKDNLLVQTIEKITVEV